MLLQKGGNSLPALAGLRQKIHDLNTGNLLPPGMQIKTLYDRTKLINTTTNTVRHVIIFGLILVTLVLLSMLGDLRITFIAAITIPFAVLFAFAMMVLTNHSANLISIGAIDFGILVESSIVVLESVHRKISRQSGGGGRRRVDRGRRQRCGKARPLRDTHHSRRLHSAFYDGGSARQDLRADVGYVWVRADRCADLCAGLRACSRIVCGTQTYAEKRQRKPDSAHS